MGYFKWQLIIKNVQDHNISGSTILPDVTDTFSDPILTLEIFEFRLRGLWETTPMRHFLHILIKRKLIVVSTGTLYIIMNLSHCTNQVLLECSLLCKRNSLYSIVGVETISKVRFVPQISSFNRVILFVCTDLDITVSFANFLFYFLVDQTVATHPTVKRLFYVLLRKFTSRVHLNWCK